jgi:hypothetical protein
LRDTPVILLSARAGEDAKVEGLQAGADDYLSKPFSARELVARVETNLRLAETRRETARLLREEAEILELLNRVGNTVAAEIDLEKAVQSVTDIATQLSGAAFGAFFYNVVNDRGGSYTLYTLSGAPRDAFAKFPSLEILPFLRRPSLARELCDRMTLQKTLATGRTILISGCPRATCQCGVTSRHRWSPPPATF